MVATNAKTGTKSLGDSSTAADTNGWDTVFAIGYTDVNKAIAKAKSSPPNFSQSSSGWTSSSLKGDFGDWEVTTGGDGKNLHMTLPLNNATLSSGGNTYGPFTGNALIEIQLQYIPQPSSTSQASTAGPNNLKVSTTPQDPNDPIVSVLSVTDLNPAPPDPVEIPSLISGLLKQWLLANLQSFNHVFAVVDLDAIADQGYFQWLKPTTVSYACTDSGDPSTSVFGVLCMTESRSAVDSNNNPLPHQITPNAIPAGANAGFLISNDRFLNKVVQPGLPALCVGASTSDFPVAADGSQITNVNKLNFQPFVVAETGQTAHPSIAAGNFSLTLFDTYMQLQFIDFTYEHAAGVTVCLNYAANAVILLSSDNHLLMQQTKSTTSGSVDTASWVTWTEFAVGIAASIIGGIAGGWAGEALSGTAEVVEGEAGPIISETVTDSEDVSESIVSDSMEEDGDDAADEVEQSDAPEPTTTKQKGWFARNWKKILGATIGSTAGMSLGQIATIMKAMAIDDMKNVPTLNDFSAEASNPITWPDATAEGYTLKSATLNGSLQLGFQVNFDH